MLRLTGGQWKGRALKVAKGLGARPTLGRVREAIFSMLGDRVAQARVLDLFAGFGALGFEALSRGALSCAFVERNRAHLRLIRQSAADLGCTESIRAVQGELPKALMGRESRRLRAPEALAPAQAGDGQFDLVFMDPPYQSGLAPDLLDILSREDESGPWLAPNAVVVLESRRTETLPTLEAFELWKDKRYGDTRVRLLVYEPSEGIRL